MHDIEPHFRWRDLYIASEDVQSPFFGRKYSEFHYTHKLYNFYLHPQWDAFGSSTLYGKLLFADYDADWAEEVHEEGGWIALINTRQHVLEEMHDARLQQYVHFGEEYNDINWRTQKPLIVFQIIDAMVNGRLRRLGE